MTSRGRGRRLWHGVRDARLPPHPVRRRSCVEGATCVPRGRARGGWHLSAQRRLGHRPRVARSHPEHRHAALVHATGLPRRTRPVFALSSTAAVWGLPRIEPWPDAVRVLVANAARGRASPWSAARGSSRCRGRDRRHRRHHTGAHDRRPRSHGATPTAVAAADHALRHGLCTADELRDEVDSVPAGSKDGAGASSSLADPLSMSPGESLSRVEMFLLNLPRPELQGRSGRRGPRRCRGLRLGRVVGEFDGKVKYASTRDADRGSSARCSGGRSQREDRPRRQVRVPRAGRGPWRSTPSDWQRSGAARHPAAPRDHLDRPRGAARLVGSRPVTRRGGRRPGRASQ